ncbi:MAG TPA: vitamin K epoxide reductase family protein [Candidatus Saccharimonadales bacterium]
MFKKIKQVFVLNNLKLKKIVISSLFISLLGIADTAYLTIAHYTQTVTLACPSTSFINCAKVTTSSYSEIFGIPVSLIGLLFFLLLTFLQLPIFWTNKYLWLKNPRLIFIGLGLVSALWFIYVELHKLRAICLYCSGAHLLIFLSLIITLFASEHLRASD